MHTDKTNNDNINTDINTAKNLNSMYGKHLNAVEFDVLNENCIVSKESDFNNSELITDSSHAAENKNSTDAETNNSKKAVRTCNEYFNKQIHFSIDDDNFSDVSDDRDKDYVVDEESDSEDSNDSGSIIDSHTVQIHDNINPFNINIDASDTSNCSIMNPPCGDQSNNRINIDVNTISINTDVNTVKEVFETCDKELMNCNVQSSNVRYKKNILYLL